MKRNFILTVLVCSLIFSLGFSTTLFSQKVTKILSKSIVVPKGTTYEIVNAQALDYEMHGSISSSGSEEGYVLRPGANKKPCLIIKNYHVKTWEKDSVKQVVKVEVIPDKNNIKNAEELVANLQINIPKKSKGIYLVDGNINIRKMELINGFFRRDRNTFILDNGKKYDVRQLVIESTLYIPKQSNVQLNTDYVGLSLDDLAGKLSINAEYGYLQAKNVTEVEGNLRNFSADFEKVGKMTLNAVFSKISAETISSLTIGSLELAGKRKRPANIFENTNRLSFSNKYRIGNINQFNIKESSSDEFNLGVINQTNIINSSFSNYYIKKIKQNFEISGRNGDVTVYDVAPKFKKINIDNQISTVELNMNSVDNYSIDFLAKDKTELRLNASLKEGAIKEGTVAHYYKGEISKGGIIEIDCEYCEIIVN